MPRKRRLEKRRLDVLTPAQESHLFAGAYLIATPRDADHFVDEAHRQAAWTRHRERILADWDQPGRRPAAFWDYDFGPWSRHGETEQAAVLHLLKAGRIQSIAFCGAYRIDDEMAAIEELQCRES
jgi:hypothetical protein